MAGGASCSNFHEVAIKQAAIASAMESILVVDEASFAA
jgi:DeoR family transcriptional regulator, deoxyribose operon repressor